DSPASIGCLEILIRARGERAACARSCWRCARALVLCLTIGSGEPVPESSDHCRGRRADCNFMQFTVASYSWFDSVANCHGETKCEEKKDCWLYRSERAKDRAGRLRCKTRAIRSPHHAGSHSSDARDLCASDRASVHRSR